MALEQLKYNLEVIGRVCINDFADVRFLLDKVGKSITLDHGRLNLGPAERGERG